MKQAKQNTSNMKQSKLLFLLVAHPRIRLLPSNGTADGGRCRTADGQH